MFSDRMGIGSTAIAAGIFVFASRLRSDRLSEPVCRVIRWLSDRTFGIHLIHVFYVALIFRILKPELFSITTAIGVLGSTLGIFLLSLLTTELFLRLPFTKKLLS